MVTGIVVRPVAASATGVPSVNVIAVTAELAAAFFTSSKNPGWSTVGGIWRSTSSMSARGLGRQQLGLSERGQERLSSVRCSAWAAARSSRAVLTSSILGKHEQDGHDHEEDRDDRRRR